MTTIDLTKLTKEQKEELAAQLTSDKKAEKEKSAADKKAFKELSAEFVNKNIDFWVTHNEITAKAIDSLWKEYKPLQQLKADAYGSKVNKQESHTSTLEDGSASITIGYNVSIGFDGTESEGVEKIKEFLKSLSTDEDKNKKLSAAVNTFLKPNAKTGMLNPSKIIELSKLKEEFNDERFNEGLQIIFDAQQKRKNSMYVSGWKFIEIEEKPVKVEFRFTV
ncbi:DUF3164 family protein [Empedobacter brevis]